MKGSIHNWEAADQHFGETHQLCFFFSFLMLQSSFFSQDVHQLFIKLSKNHFKWAYKVCCHFGGRFIQITAISEASSSSLVFKIWIKETFKETSLRLARSSTSARAKTALTRAFSRRILRSGCHYPQHKHHPSTNCIDSLGRLYFSQIGLPIPVETSHGGVSAFELVPKLC